MRLGVIGFGGRIQGVIEEIKRFDDDCRIVAITDIRNEEIKNQLDTEGIHTGRISFYSDVDEMLSHGRLDGICVGTRCSLHAKMAIKVLPSGIPLYLEKPVATNMEDLLELRSTYYKSKQSADKVVVSFPLRVTPLLQIVKEIVESGRIGTVEHVQAINNVPYGGVYFHHWYRDENESGGLFLQKATHDFDYINYVLGIKPVRICAMASKQIFKGNKPEKLMCKDCNEQETCLDSPFNLDFLAQEEPTGEYCSFACDTGNEDSGSALIEYETGMHVSYTQNFFARKSAAKRGARFLGYNGTVEFDWVKDEVNVIMHHSPRVENISMDSTKMSHGGGDAVLARNFVQLMRGGEKRSVAPLDAGLISVLMCLKARESAMTKTFRDITWPEDDE